MLCSLPVAVLSPRLLRYADDECRHPTSLRSRARRSQTQRRRHSSSAKAAPLTSNPPKHRTQATSHRRLLKGQSHPSKPQSTPNPANQSARVLCVTRRTKPFWAPDDETRNANPKHTLTLSFFVILCHHHPYSIGLRLIWRRAHGPAHCEPPFIPPTEPGNAALVRAPSTRGCVSAGRWHLNRRRCAHVRLHGFDQFRPYGVRTRTARHHSGRSPSPPLTLFCDVKQKKTAPRSISRVLRRV